MKVKLLRSYKSQNGNTVFVYTVSGNASQLEAYKNASGDFYREDENGTPLWFTTRCIGQRGTLIITAKVRWCLICLHSSKPQVLPSSSGAIS